MIIEIGDILIDHCSETFGIVLTKLITISNDPNSIEAIFDLDDTTYWDQIVDSPPLKDEI